MNTLDAKEAGEKLDRILDEAAEADQPVLITSLRANAVLVPEEAGSHGQCISVRGLFSRQRSQFAAPALAGNHLICKEEPTDRKALSVATHSRRSVAAWAGLLTFF
jgi:hypothetical protein